MQRIFSTRLLVNPIQHQCGLRTIASRPKRTPLLSRVPGHLSKAQKNNLDDLVSQVSKSPLKEPKTRKPKNVKTTEEREEAVSQESIDQALEFIRDLKPSEIVIPQDLLAEPKAKLPPIEMADVLASLKESGATDLFVIETSFKCNWVNQIIVVTGGSRRHMLAIGEQLVKEFKYNAKYHSGVNTQTEGKQSEDWMAVDLGTMLVNIFSAPARERYEVEVLWALKHDEELSDAIDPVEYKNAISSKMEIDGFDSTEL
ncbi:hypothetical protein PROFUN_13630 [Planoprotostelium fungivorum]|uniref:Uncharacterized protein n=1 Tax=Planoprotostelium fungivorum TaxID=1890364 RepID=A0A2P6MZW9_9EUKA|nr:hypothetical protein PROFUN_13630 [Planoprotostelium fungivorum]